MDLVPERFHTRAYPLRNFGHRTRQIVCAVKSAMHSYYHVEKVAIYSYLLRMVYLTGTDTVCIDKLRTAILCEYHSVH